MGVSGCGKSTIGTALAQHLNSPFIEGDALHSAEARTKMSNGIQLTDEDRWPWLRRVALALKNATQSHGSAIASCSALKKSYRQFLAAELGQPVTFIYLELSEDEATKRLANRTNHFMPAALVRSQFQALEPPQPDEFSIKIDATLNPKTIVQLALAALND